MSKTSTFMSETDASMSSNEATSEVALAFGDHVIYSGVLEPKYHGRKMVVECVWLDLIGARVGHAAGSTMVFDVPNAFSLDKEVSQECTLDDLRAELKITRAELDNVANERDELAANNSALYARVQELEALRPKPVVKITETHVYYGYHEGGPATVFGHGKPNVQFTFHDNLPVRAKVKNEKGEWV